MHNWNIRPATQLITQVNASSKLRMILPAILFDVDNFINNYIYHWAPMQYNHDNYHTK